MTSLTPPSSENGGTPRPKARRSLVLALVVVVFAIAGVGLFVYYTGSPGGSSTQSVEGPSLMRATCSELSNGTATVQHEAIGGNGSHVYFLIVAADPPSPYAGFNGSYYVPTTQQWPTMNVKAGQVVTIHVINCASSEPHGFQVQYYDDNTVIVIPVGQSYTVTFTANKVGTYRVYCDIFCSIHPLMQNGALIVS